MKVETQPHCSICKKLTKELFEKKSKWVCIDCKEKTRPTKGRIVKTKPPTGIGRGTMLNRSKRDSFNYRPE